MKPVRKKRILHQICINEISAVDRPAQEGATMALMKRADPSLISLQDRLLVLRDRVDTAILKFDPDQPRDAQGQWTSTGAGGGESSPTPSTPASTSPSVPSNRGAWFRSALENVAIGAVLRSGPLKHAVGNIVFRLATATALSNPYTATLLAGAAITGVRVTGLLNYAGAVLDLMRSARNAEISKAAQDPIIAAIDRAKRALAAFKQSKEYKQAKEKERTQEPFMSFERHADEIRKRDNCSHTEALRKARQEAPAAFQNYNTPPLAKSARDFDSLLEIEIAKGYPPNVARQQVVTKFGVHPPREAADERGKRGL